MNADSNKTAKRKSGRRRLVTVWALIICGALIGAILSGAFSPKEPRFGGKSLSEILKALVKAGQINVYSWEEIISDKDARPIREIGEAATPFLLDWFRSGLSAEKYRDKLLNLPTQLPSKVLEPGLTRRVDKASEAMFGFYALGEKGSNAMPALIKMLAELNLDNFNVSDARAIFLIMAHIGTPAAVTAISSGLASTNIAMVDAAANAAGSLGRQGISLVPGLILILTNTNVFDSARWSAMRSLGLIGEPADLVRPALCKFFTSTNEIDRRNAAISLAFMGKKAEAAIPDIETHLKTASGKLDCTVLTALIVICNDDKRIAAAIEKNFHFPNARQARIANTSALFSSVFESVRANWIKVGGSARSEIWSAVENIKPEEGMK